MIKLAVSGCCGKMGARIISLAQEDKELKLSVALEQKGHKNIGQLVDGIKITDEPDEIKDADCLMEFTNPSATVEHLEYALKYKKPMVIGTTGLPEEEKLKIKKAAETIPIVFSPNMSVGVNVLFALVKLSAEKLGKDYAVNIIEAHHIHKKDAPSGTAKKIAEIVKETSDRDVKDIKSIREREIVGDHEIIFESDVDIIKISHSAKTRDIFAQGALKAAKWIINKSAGLYSMQDLLSR